MQGYVEEYFKKAWFSKILKKEKPALVVFSSLHVPKRLASVCIRKKIPYMVMHYDTTVENPIIAMTERRIEQEKFVVENSEMFFVPKFFYEGYLRYYNSKKIKPYNLPLLIDKKEVLSAYDAQSEQYGFSYFGQLQSFRKGDVVNGVFEKLGKQLHVFSAKEPDCGNAFTWHPALTKEELYKVVAHSDFLVALDNGAPYEHFLPSKAYLYVSFTKPIIVFGDNEKSAIKEFFKGYPYFYYQDINAPLDGLKGFLKKDWQGFNEHLYNNYKEYSVEVALAPIVETIQKKTNGQ